MEKLKIAVIGAGNIARNAHLPVYAERDDVEIVAICDWNLDRAKEIAAKFNIPHAYTTVEETLEKHPEIEAVDICVWNRSHAPVAIAAAKAGKHILCEKPMAWSVKHAEQMKKAVDEAGVTFMVAVMTRYANESQVLKAEIDSGRLGDIYYAKTGYMRRRGHPHRLVYRHAKVRRRPGDRHRHPLHRPHLVSHGQAEARAHFRLHQLCHRRVQDQGRQPLQGFGQRRDGLRHRGQRRRHHPL